MTCFAAPGIVIGTLFFKVINGHCRFFTTSVLKDKSNLMPVKQIEAIQSDEF